MMQRVITAAVLLLVLTGHPHAVNASASPSVSLGGRVYIDRDLNGELSHRDQGIGIARLVLTGPDGLPVVDVDGIPVDEALTDNDGRYVFDKLPLLADGESYAVSLPPENFSQSTIAIFAGGVAVADPLNPIARSMPLTSPGDSDESLDFVLVYNVPAASMRLFTTSEGPVVGDHEPDDPQLVDADTPIPLTYRIFNNGVEPLLDLNMSISLSGTGTLSPAECDFSVHGGPTSTAAWAGPFPVGASADCVAEFSGMPAGSEFQAFVGIDAVGEDTQRGIPVDPESWNAFTAELEEPTTTTVASTTTTPDVTSSVAPTGVLPETGQRTQLAWLALVMTLAGGTLVVLSARRGLHRKHRSRSAT